MNKLSKRLSLLAVMCFLAASIAQGQENQSVAGSLKKQRVITEVFLQMTAISNTKNASLKGIGVEYYIDLNRWWSVSAALSHARSNTIPQDPNALKNAQGRENYNSIPLTNETSVVSNRTVNQSMLGGLMYFKPINTPKHLLYISNGLGYYITDATQQKVDEVYYRQGTTVQKVNMLAYVPKNTQNLSYMVNVGYDRTFGPWSIGFTLKGQLPIIRDRYFFTTNNGVGSIVDDEMAFMGVKFGRWF